MTSTDTQATAAAAAAQATKPTTWAVLELFGHTRLAGAVSEHAYGGDTFTRVDVPAVTYADTGYVDGVSCKVMRTIPAHTKLLGAKSVFSLSFVDEAAALLAAHHIRHEPIKQWELRAGLENLSQTDRRLLLGPTQQPVATNFGASS